MEIKNNSNSNTRKQLLDTSNYTCRQLYTLLKHTICKYAYAKYTLVRHAKCTTVWQKNKMWQNMQNNIVNILIGRAHNTRSLLHGDQLLYNLKARN